MSNSARGRTQNRELESCDGNKKKEKKNGGPGAPVARRVEISVFVSALFWTTDVRASRRRR